MVRSRVDWWRVLRWIIRLSGSVWNVAAAGQSLSFDTALIKHSMAKVERIGPNRIGKYSRLQEWVRDLDDSSNKHWHVWHLWAVYPGKEINGDCTPELSKDAGQSSVERGDAATL